MNSFLALHTSPKTFISILENTQEELLLIYAKVYIEMDLGKCLIEKIFLDFSKFTSEHSLDYKIGVFRCRTCFEYGHEAFGCETEINLTNKILKQGISLQSASRT